MHDHPLRRDIPQDAPGDLEPFEAGVAAQFRALERHDAPSSVAAAVAQARPARARLLRLVPRVSLDGWPLGAWGLASAAVLLLAIGVAVTVELTDPATISPESLNLADQVHDLTIVEDGRMALFHDLETFDDVGLAPGHLIADWGR